MITRNFKRFLKKDKNFTRRAPKGSDTKNEPIICFKCKKPSHIKVNCSLSKKNHKKTKKRAMKATSDDSDSDSSNDELSDDEIANICLVAHLCEVCLKSSSKDKWFLDSGCLRHMTRDKSKFSSLSPKDGGRLTFGDN